MTDERQSLVWQIEGTVQGVGFRAWMCDVARSLDIAGWVRNRRNGQVEALVRGPAAALDRLRDACRRGPPAASVTGLVERPAEPHELAETPFEQRPTA